MAIVQGMLSVSKAAALAGMTSSRIRQMIRAYNERCPSGRCVPRANECKAQKVVSDMFPSGHAWVVSMEEVNRIKNSPAKEGRPRGPVK